ncbi:hypothetical protein [Nonomuraea salmonea]|uniref:hypothetical protein n=1 Tax=Nonomuraea salmonea TaxID=46181 RepID=UPI0031EB282D
MPATSIISTANRVTAPHHRLGVGPLGPPAERGELHGEVAAAGQLEDHEGGEGEDLGGQRHVDGGGSGG